MPYLSRLTFLSAACVSGALLGCAIPTHSTRLAAGPEPVSVQVRPGMPRTGQGAELLIESPGADSIVLESANGLDRYWNDGPRLRVSLTDDFGDSTHTLRHAERRDGQLLDVLKRPARIWSCRQGYCREFHHEIPLKLSERNQHSVSLTAGWSTVFARRSITGGDRVVLFQEALNSGIWTVQGEWAGRNWSARAQGFHSQDEQGGALDLSRVVKHSGDMKYGLSMHAGVSRQEWLPDLSGPIPTGRAVYHVGIGPSLMLQGITASSQFGVSTDGRETLQTVSTRISANGNLTAVRQPIILTAEKVFAFGSGPIVARRRDALGSLSAAVHVLDDFAVRVGVTSRRSAWPDEHPADDLQGSETLVTLGGQYSLTW
ncbi:MAG: hypothetical protein ACR2HK_02710 [Gemmatimonadales bacterium]